MSPAKYRMLFNVYDTLLWSFCCIKDSIECTVVQHSYWISAVSRGMLWTSGRQRLSAARGQCSTPLLASAAQCDTELVLFEQTNLATNHWRFLDYQDRSSKCFQEQNSKLTSWSEGKPPVLAEPSTLTLLLFLSRTDTLRTPTTVISSLTWLISSMQVS